ncbi:ABC transporter B family member 26, chloroplastic isoform X5 [Vitis vinifera]|uniref:ABC transporter B family member 26, chloroplastic isoform X5 n=1 Tax=Vitis vinifera TaxID=29760 RepID=UPI0005402681|nr:ABC transporter B family member 26, chloroplastic isoform X5 [Vitis vinifera]XP_010660857.1 ABC transporter B family member 26, chloroplastic isoform X5 [Vitis vinifera]|eukprot:XP_010660856.1 PREDICTED: ABC transporter B family member 26, chloroplastic isoform X1 [Vitis vinifera]
MAASQLAFRPLSKPHFPLRRTLSSTITFSSTRFRCSCLPKTGQINVEIPVVLRNIRSVLPGGSWWKLSEYEEEAKAREVMPTLRRIWVLVEDERWVIFVAVGSLTLAALSEISMPNLIAASVFSAQSGETMVFYRNSQLLILLCILSGICSGLRSGCFAIANITLVKRLRETLCSAILFQVCVYLATIFVMLSTMHTPQDIDFFETEAVGDLTSRLGADCQQLSNIIGNDINMILRNFLQGAGALIHLLTLSWPLALSTIVICSVLSAIFLVYGQYRRKAAMFTQEFTACANEVAQETFSLMRTVRTYGTEENELRRYKQWLDKLAFVSIRESVAYGFWGLSFNTLYRSTQVIAVLLGGMSILTGHVTPEQLTKYILYCEWLIYGTLRLGDNFASLLQSVGASGKVFQLMDLLPSDQFKSEGVKLKRLMGHIEFANVSFYYPSRVMVPVLEHVNISVQANEVVAIVGISGSGKSSLVNLLLRLYEPTTGQILIDGFPLRELDIGWLRGKIGFVGQEPHLFHMDVKSNIRYGCSRDIGQEDIEWAAKLAYAHGFISSLPDGYDTIIDDHLLSGGQKQRIAIARAILRGPAILILDEATSALDAESEHYVEGVLHAFRNDANAKRTVIVIAHRLSTVKAADRIVVMDGGSVIEVGDHQQLLLKDGLYAKLIKTQTDALA